MMNSAEIIQVLDEIGEKSKYIEDQQKKISDYKNEMIKIADEIEKEKSFINQYENYEIKPNEIQLKWLNNKEGVIANYFFALSLEFIIVLFTFGLASISDRIAELIMPNLKVIEIECCLLFLIPIILIPSVRKYNVKRKESIIIELEKQKEKFKKKNEMLYNKCVINLSILNTKKITLETAFAATDNFMPILLNELNRYVDILPKRYMTSKAIYSFKEYLQYGRAFSIGECINIFENEMVGLESERRHQDMLKMEEQRRIYEEAKHEELVNQNNETNSKFLEKQEQIRLQNEEQLKLQKQQLKLDKERMEIEAWERRKRESEEFDRRLHESIKRTVR